MSHGAAVRHTLACEQHLLWMQSPQGVPSVGHGVDEQVPATQFPPQHCAALVHVLPSGWHVEPPHAPCASHGPEQQDNAGLQTCPSTMHVAGAHTPLVQLPSQHRGPLLPHACPRYAHGPPPQIPLTHGSSPQHEAPAALHAAPKATHVGGYPHVPPLQT